MAVRVFNFGETTKIGSIHKGAIGGPARRNAPRDDYGPPLQTSFGVALYYSFTQSSQPSMVPMTVVSVETKYFPSSGASSPALVVQVTCLVDSYMLWIGVTEELEEESAGRAILRGNLGKDWAVAMPPWKVRTYGGMEE